MISLREVVEEYERAARAFGVPVALASLAIPGDISRLFSAYDEDYHISRFLHFTNEAGKPFSINGFPATHISIDAGIKDLL